MLKKAYISDFTWRTDAQQCATLSEYFGSEWGRTPLYSDEEGLGVMLRPTTRKEILAIYVSSIAVLAKSEGALRLFLKNANSRETQIRDIEHQVVWGPGIAITKFMKAWRAARVEDSGKHGGLISATAKKAASKQCADLIRDRWPLPSNEWPTKVLLKEAGISLNTAKRLLGRRPIEQANYQAKMKRKEAKAA